MTYIHREYHIGLDAHGDPVAKISFNEDELRAMAEAMGSHDGACAELHAIADRLTQ